LLILLKYIIARLPDEAAMRLSTPKNNYPGDKIKPENSEVEWICQLKDGNKRRRQTPPDRPTGVPALWGYGGGDKDCG